MKRFFRAAGAGVVIGILLASSSPRAAVGEEEFAGPFPSWRDARRDYSARGDGQADDTAALQRGLDDLTKHTNFCVLYLPASTYRLSATLKTVRQAHTDCQGVAVIGDHPDPARSASGAGPLDDRGTVDDATLLRHLAPLRAARVWLPNASVPTDATDLRLHRVMVDGGDGAVVEFRR